MKSKIDWFFLKRTLVFFIIAVLACAALIILGMQFEKAGYENYKKGEANLRTTHKLYENMVNDIDLLEQFTVKFNDYKSTGLIGGERRLSWIESLESTNAVLRLPTLSYNLQSQEGFVRSGLKVGRNVLVNSSPMALKMSLLHEEDLFALIEGLSSSISNLFSVDSCELVITGSVGKSFATKQANLNADCVIRWVSIDVK